MKILTLLFVFSIFGLSHSCAPKEKVDVSTVKVNHDNEAEAQTSEGKKIQMQEDVDYDTTDGREIRYDKDPIGDDEVEIDD